MKTVDITFICLCNLLYKYSRLMHSPAGPACVWCCVDGNNVVHKFSLYCLRIHQLIPFSAMWMGAFFFFLSCCRNQFVYYFVLFFLASDHLRLGVLINVASSAHRCSSELNVFQQRLVGYITITFAQSHPRGSFDSWEMKTTSSDKYIY